MNFTSRVQILDKLFALGLIIMSLEKAWINLSSPQAMSK